MPRALFPLILSLLAALFLLMRAPFAASDMDALLPPDAALPAQEQALLQAAETAQGRQLLLLVGAAAPLPAAQAVVRDWQASGLVADIAIARGFFPARLPRLAARRAAAVAQRPRRVFRRPRC